MTTHSNKVTGDSEVEELKVDVRNIGGISECHMTLSPDVTLLAGENASNKSSFLRSLSAVLGGPAPPLKSDADNGYVRLEIGDEEYYVELSKQNGSSVVTEAKQFSDFEDLCELFVTLDETNPVRQAIVNGGDLYSLLMRPIDTEEIEAEIKRLIAMKDSLDNRLSELDRMEDRLPTLQTQLTNLQQKTEEVETTLREKRNTIDKWEAETATEDDSEALEELRTKRSERETVRNRIRTQQEAIESLRDELDSITKQLEEFEGGDMPSDVDDTEHEIEQLHHQKQQLTTTINSLSPIVEMNSQLLDDGDEIPAEMKSDDVIAELDPESRTITCWTCGSSVERSEINQQVRVVKEILQEKRNQREMITDRIHSLKEQRRMFERQKEERDQLLEQKSSTEDEIDRREEQLSDLQIQENSLREAIEALQEEVEESGGQDDALGELYEEVSDLEYERGKLENDLEDVQTEIERIESNLSERGDVEDERESIATQLQEQRNQIEMLERDLVTTFNEMMQEVLDLLNYEKVERVWIERLADGNSPSGTEFELHIVRSTEDGAAYEDTIDNLSKSEREVISLVVALAGYLAHDVATELPFIIVDAVEMLDAERIRGLLKFFSQYADYVVTAVLPEEARELEGVFPTISTSSFAAET